MTHNQSSPEHSPRIVRYQELKPCHDAFIDTRTPGSNQKENFTIIGPGVSENPNQHVHIIDPHGFNIGAARQPKACTNSQHSHETEEVFFVHSGKWVFKLGEYGKDATVILRPGDLISIPTHLFRGFENIGEETGFLWAILGGDDPGRVLWAPHVFDLAQKYGLILLENGSLIDTTKNESIPKGLKPMPVTSAEQVSALKTFHDEHLKACCVFAEDIRKSHLEKADQKTFEHPLIGPNAKLDWPHCFTISQIRLANHASTDINTFSGHEVVFVHKGVLTLKTLDGIWEIAAGDTVTIPKKIKRQYLNRARQSVEFIRVRGNI